MRVRAPLGIALLVALLGLAAPPQAGAQSTVTLSPASDTNELGTQHCVTATVQETGVGPLVNVRVDFTVTGPNPTNGSVFTNANGQATFCYTGAETGTDTITADVDAIGQSANATKTWFRVASVTLAPKSATNAVGTQHCVTATVRDQSGVARGGIPVTFTLSGAHTGQASGSTDPNGQVQACYTGQVAGTDTITATARGFSDTATKTWVTPSQLTSLSLAPETATNTVGTEHCVTATLNDQNGIPVSGVEVTFQVSGANSAQGLQSTDLNGQTRFCYTGQKVGTDTITATAGGLSDTASKEWVAVGPPKLGKLVRVRPQNGTVLIDLPGPGGFVPLEQVRQIPVGSVLDTREGTVRLTSARDNEGNTQTGFFGNAIFRVLQGRKSKGLTDLVLLGGDFSACGSSARRGALSKQIIRKLRARARRGRFRTRGRYSAGTVRGTVWSHTDRCDGTVTQVFRGSLRVRDLVRDKTIIVPAGKGYIARPPGF